jgi:hypothetical protein
MKKSLFVCFYFLFYLYVNASSKDETFFEFEGPSLFTALQSVEDVNKKINDRLPLTLNYVLQGGYFTMPSARMPKTGNLGLNFSYLPPYSVYSGSFQMFSHLELSANYWVFNGILEGNFGHMGFGDDADRAANVKVALLQKTDGINFLPEIALGINDFIGTKRFHSFYIVGTQEFLEADLEVSLGWGTGRIGGFFGGCAWSPFRLYQNFFRNLSFIIEYDANDYKTHKYEHRRGREVKFPVNIGAQFRAFNDLFQLSVSSIRGVDVAASIAFNYNIGESKGLFPKTDDPLFYSSPLNFEPLGLKRSQEELAQEFAYAFKEQGFSMYTMKLTADKQRKKHLWIKIVNNKYRLEDQVRLRIEKILSSLIPDDVFSVVVATEADGIIAQEYCYRSQDLEKYGKGRLSSYELSVISPPKEARSQPGYYDSTFFYNRKKKIWLFTLRPDFKSYFGSREGKFKYDVGFLAGPEGYLFNNIYYDLLVSYIIKSSSGHISDRDYYNPSQILNVRSDLISYNQSNSFHVETAYLQQGWNLGKGWFARVSLGYFEIAYAGIGLEALYYPVLSDWAIGFEFSPILKRKYSGMGFQKKVRKFKGIEAEYVKYTGLQFFVDLYYKYRPLNLDFKISIGQFLAKDKGARFEMGRYFSSGLFLGVWYTLTNAKDMVNGHRYFDKGFSFSLPLDLFLQKSSRSRFNYGMSAWLRDVGVRSNTGRELYPTLFFERQESY